MPVNGRRGGPRLSNSLPPVAVRPGTCFATMGRVSKAVLTTLEPPNLWVANAVKELG
jgi:hypothetical protein